jgi:hypothetical protein
VQAQDAGFDWRDWAAYAPLLGADRSFFAWEWLRRDPAYCAAWNRARSSRSAPREEHAAAAAFGLVAFEDPRLTVPYGRPVWRSEAYPPVLTVDRSVCGKLDDAFALVSLSSIARLVAAGHREHLILTDGLRALRLDGPAGTFTGGQGRLRYQIEGMVTAEAQLLTLRRFLALCRTGRFSRSLHPREPRARRWIRMLRAWDALLTGAGQREIAEVLVSRTASEPRWREREPSIRSQVQRLVGAARAAAAGGYRKLLLPPGNCQR